MLQDGLVILTYTIWTAESKTVQRSCVFTASHLGSVRRVHGVIDIRCVPPEFLQKFARLEAVHARQAVIGRAEDVSTIT